jgi:uncharacterized protein (DUF433 family)
MIGSVRLYTPAEAGAVSGLKLKAVHNAIDKRIIKPVVPDQTATSGKIARARSRYLTGEDLVRLRVWHGVGDSLSAERRQKLFAAIAASPESKTVKADDLLIVDVAEARRQVDRGVRELEAAEAIVTRDKAVLGGEPVFRGTRIPVHGIVAMLEAGASAEDLLSGYPRLSARVLDLARIWAVAHPRRGRPKSLGDLGLELKSSRRALLKPDPLTNRSKAATTAAG